MALPLDGLPVLDLTEADPPAVRYHDDLRPPTLLSQVGVHCGSALVELSGLDTDAIDALRRDGVIA